jgi:hypothetical protein
MLLLLSAQSSAFFYFFCKQIFPLEKKASKIFVKKENQIRNKKYVLFCIALSKHENLYLVL